MNILATIGLMILSTIIVLVCAYILANIILPLFNIRVNIRIKFYKANKAL